MRADPGFSLLFAALLAGSSSCKREPPTSAGSAQSSDGPSAGVIVAEAYRTSDGKEMIKVISSDELEYNKNGVNLVCKYTKSGGDLRVVATIDGTIQAVYFSTTVDGLRRDDGVLFLPPPWKEPKQPLLDDEVTMEMIEQKWRGDVLWVDTRRPEDFEKAHIPGALLLSSQEMDTNLAAHIEAFQSNSRPIIFYGSAQTCRAVRTYVSNRFPGGTSFVLKDAKYDHAEVKETAGKR